MESGYSSPRTDAFPAGLRVLVVDDDLVWLRILEKMLKKCSYEVVIDIRFSIVDIAMVISAIFSYGVT
ncbi:hypothetical protein U1Q18_017193 [Sarracenia purpurea var. burkii]